MSSDVAAVSKTVIEAKGESSHLPDIFVEFCSKHALDTRMYTEIPVDVFPRFIRVNLLRRNELDGSEVVEDGRIPLREAELRLLSAAFNSCVSPVRWLDPSMCFCVMDGRINLSSSKLYRDGLVHGMDVSSAASVLALSPQPYESILDMCCAPGAKLCLIAEMMQAKGSLVGVDFSPERLSICASLLRKYGVIKSGAVQQGWRLQLYACDGRDFNQSPPSVPDYDALDTSDAVVSSAVYKSVRKWHDSETTTATEGLTEPVTAKAHNSYVHAPVLDSFYENCFRRKLEQRRKGLYSVSAQEQRIGALFLQSHQLPHQTHYDKVIVDAECTHDGSLKHVAKFGSSWGWEALDDHINSTKKAAELMELQRSLIAKGYELIREGGVLVYSTCSLTLDQNERIVEWLLSTFPTAEIDPLSEFLHPSGAVGLLPHDLPAMPLSAIREACYAAHSQHVCPAREGGIPGTIRFEPLISGCGGLFIARVRKGKAHKIS